MIVATRTLTLRVRNHNTEIPISVHAPEEEAASNWICRFEIGWPEGKAEHWGAGVDAIQALFITLQMIGAEVYTNDHHKAGHLSWMERDNGYGFPVPSSIRDLLVGDDARYS